MVWHFDGNWPLFAIALLPMLLWLAFIILAAVLVIRLVNNPGRHAPPTIHPGAATSEPAEEVLRRRFAAGEIDEDEYRRRLDVLRNP